jgi:hypothetical protein
VSWLAFAAAAVSLGLSGLCYSAGRIRGRQEGLVEGLCTGYFAFARGCTYSEALEQGEQLFRRICLMSLENRASYLELLRHAEELGVTVEATAREDFCRDG